MWNSLVFETLRVYPVQSDAEVLYEHMDAFKDF